MAPASGGGRGGGAWLSNHPIQYPIFYSSDRNFVCQCGNNKIKRFNQFIKNNESTPPPLPITATVLSVNKSMGVVRGEAGGGPHLDSTCSRWEVVTGKPWPGDCGGKRPLQRHRWVRRRSSIFSAGLARSPPGGAREHLAAELTLAEEEV